MRNNEIEFQFLFSFFSFFGYSQAITKAKTKNFQCDIQNVLPSPYWEESVFLKSYNSWNIAWERENEERNAEAVALSAWSGKKFGDS